jgi:hypothetical protein
MEKVVESPASAFMGLVPGLILVGLEDLGDASGVRLVENEGAFVEGVGPLADFADLSEIAEIGVKEQAVLHHTKAMQIFLILADQLVEVIETGGL